MAIEDIRTMRVFVTMKVVSEWQAFHCIRPAGLLDAGTQIPPHSAGRLFQFRHLFNDVQRSTIDGGGAVLRVTVHCNIIETWNVDEGSE